MLGMFESFKSNVKTYLLNRNCYYKIDDKIYESLITRVDCKCSESHFEVKVMTASDRPLYLAGHYNTMNPDNRYIAFLSLEDLLKFYKNKEG